MSSCRKVSPKIISQKPFWSLLFLICAFLKAHFRIWVKGWECLEEFDNVRVIQNLHDIDLLFEPLEVLYLMKCWLLKCTLELTFFTIETHFFVDWRSQLEQLTFFKSYNPLVVDNDTKRLHLTWFELLLMVLMALCCAVFLFFPLHTLPKV